MSTRVIIPQELLHSIGTGLFSLVVLFFIVILQKFFTLSTPPPWSCRTELIFTVI